MSINSASIANVRLTRHFKSLPGELVDWINQNPLCYSLASQSEQVPTKEEDYLDDLANE